MNNITLWPCVLPGAYRFICEGYHISLSYGINKALDVYAYKFCALFFPLFYLYFVYTAMLLHTLMYHTADPYPLWIPLITALLLPVMTSKIRPTKPRTKVRTIMRYLENLLDYYNRKRGSYSLMKSRLRQ